MDFIDFIDSFKTPSNDSLIETISIGYQSIFESEGRKTLPKYLYHATFEFALDNIAKFGLGSSKADKQYAYTKTSDSDHVYLAENYDDALEYARESNIVEQNPKLLSEIVVLQVPTNKLNLTKLKKDPNLDIQSGTYIYYGTIPQKDLAIIDA
jgi:hypothetical protein